MSSGPPAVFTRRLPLGAEPGVGGAHFRVWAPDRERMDVVLPERVEPLSPEPEGWFGGWVADVGPGDLYRLRTDDDVTLPDPASRSQPSGPHGPSEVVDPGAFPWTDGDWPGPVAERPVLYETHIGTFTPEGTWTAAIARLPALADLGVTLLELMPVAEFPGSFGWGYDGAALFAPYHGYGRPDDLRRFVDRAHALGMGVILDVVYNHFGPDGNYLAELAGPFVSAAHQTAWGAAINFDGPGSEHVRSFFRANVRHWVEEYHVDGFRLDATQDIHDTGEPHILADLTREARFAARGRRCVMLAENEPQEARLLRAAEDGGCGFDGVWNDDFHHSAMVALTGRREAYYTDFRGAAQELVSAAKRGFLYQGQWYSWQGQRRGTSTRGVRRDAFVHYLENHDQVANSASGARLVSTVGPGPLRAMTALLLVTPGMPMLFQGQEYGSTRPFTYFADHQGELAGIVRRGRAGALEEFPSLATPEIQAGLPDPSDPETFRRCVLDDSDPPGAPEWRRLHRDLIGLRRRDPVLRAADPELDGAVLADDALVLRWFDEHGDRLLILNLGPDLRLRSVPEPLLAPWRGARWTVLWSSESAAYGGRGTPPVETESDGWRLPGQAAVIMAPDGKEER
ncbi:MAG TPA: malto-oligosyltrehalose trehalohydrolase [Longimicrobiales bacterium]|nr:malto-oligosyltrehalose trehalohydrolase [Longimicrobiales bacterium]